MLNDESATQSGILEAEPRTKHLNVLMDENPCGGLREISETKTVRFTYTFDND